MPPDEFDHAMDAEWARRKGGARWWMALGAVAGALVLGVFGWSWSQVVGAGALVGALAIGAVAGAGIAWLIVRSQARRAAHLTVAARWARDNGWAYAQKVDVPGIDLGFLRQGDRRYCEDGASGQIGGHPAQFANFTVENDSTDGKGNRHTSYDHYFIVVVHRAWEGPRLTMVRRSLGLGRGMRDAVRSAATSRQVVDLEHDDFADEFQVTIPDEWGRDVAFLLIPPDVQEALMDGTRLEDVRQVDAAADFLFLAWRSHFSADDLPLLDDRLADTAWLLGRWGDVPPAMRPVARGEGG